MLQRFRIIAHFIDFSKTLIVVNSGVAAILFMQSSLAGPMDTPPSAVLAEAKQIVKEMIANPRGPYDAIRWYCKDGTVLAPTAFACKDHGGGIQHAQYSEQRTRLAELGWSVGTLFAPLDFVSLKNQKPRAQRLRELALERYLIDVDDGWVLRKAKDYRGRAQIEDETASGDRIMRDALSDIDWVNDNYLLLRELARVIPHDQETDISRRVRRAAIDLAERAPSAEPLRAEIHSSPSRKSAERVRSWASKLPSTVDSRVLQLANSLANDLEQMYGDQGVASRLGQQLSKLTQPSVKQWAANVTQSLKSKGYVKIADLCEANSEVRESLLATASVSDRLALIDTLGLIETEVQVEFLLSQGNILRSREVIFDYTNALLNCVYAAGLLSDGERLSARQALNLKQPSTDTYKSAVAQLKRLPGWAASNVRYTFAEALVSYGALDSRAVRFTDDLLRGSPLWLLGDVLKILNQDVAQLSGSEVLIADEIVSSAIALNPGMARGTLRIFETLDAAENALLAATDIVALPETIAELKPVAGILTLGEGNALSHVQLLARNFGIPNLAIDFSIIDLLKPLEGKEVILVVSSEGNAVLKEEDEIESLQTLLAFRGQQEISNKISVPPANLGLKNILSIEQINRTMSGKVIGPKAANLGELNRLFPGRVAPALAVPFGIYRSHLDNAGIGARIDNAYTKSATGDLSQDQLNAELESIRLAINALELSTQLKASLVGAMQTQFGDSGSYGVFIRSDTNVEDLPQFTGAGLSETLANISGTDNIFKGVPRVWASVLSPRAIAWRSNLLSNPEQIYASVLIMKSVPSEKSGVLVTANLADASSTGLTVSTAWGVGGAVAGEAAESLVILPNGDVSLISEAKTPYQRELNNVGGVNWQPAASGAVLTPGDLTQLRSLAAEVNAKYAPVFDESGKQRPWDIEFGFVDGELTLFQIRPLVEKNSMRADAVLARLRPKSIDVGNQSKAVNLSLPPLFPSQDNRNL